MIHRAIRFQCGFTLVEAVMVITITGVIAAMVAVFIKKPVEGYFDTVRRAELTDIADTAARRISRDIQNALPNSVRVNGTNSIIEFVPIEGAGRYCADVGSGANACVNALDVTSTGKTFDVLGPPVSAGASLVIYNLGIPGSSDVYDGTSRRTITASGSSITFSGSQFPLGSPGSRFQTVTAPVSYACDLASGTLWRYSGYAFQAAQPATVAALNALVGGGGVKVALATRLDPATGCSLEYANAVLQRDGLVSIHLALTKDGETVTLLHQVKVDNTP